MKRSRFLTLSALYLATHSAVAEDTAQKSSEQVTQSTSISAEAVVVEQLAGEFAPLIGSREDAGKLIQGLLKGSPASLPDAANPDEPEVRIVPPPGVLKPADIHAALSLAQAQLKAKGIVNPAPAGYLRSSLVGGMLPNAQGDMTRVIGILPLHQRGMKWEQIARALHVALPAPWSAAAARQPERKS